MTEPPYAPASSVSVEPGAEEAAVAPGLGRSRRQFERYTQICLDLLVAMFGALLILEVWAGPDPWGADDALLTVGVLALMGVSVTMIHRLPYGRWPGWGWVLALVVPGALVTGGLAAGRSPDDLYDKGTGIYFSALMALVIVFTALSLFAPWKRLMPYAIGVPLAIAGLLTVTGVPWIAASVVAFYGVFAALLGLASGATTAWMLGILRRLDEARSTSARLAVAEERLRFSRDLHDVYGRTLSAIAIKSELAAELAARGDERGVAEMRSVRALAQDSLAEVRSIVAGYREITLEAEVAGAAATLRSAGARFEVRGLDEVRALLSQRQATALAWAVREAVTNVIRHSSARLVTLGAQTKPGLVVVTIRNDGVSTSADSGSGTGLTGLSERLRPVGATVETHRDADTFTLVVTLSGAPAEHRDES